MPLVGDRRALGRGLSSIVPDAERDRSLVDIMRRVEVLEGELARHEERTEGMSAEEMYLRTQEFIDRNPLVWSALKTLARQAVREQSRFSIKKVVEDLRGSSLVQRGTGESFEFNSSLTSTLLRFLLKEVPKLKPLARTKSCKTDKYFNGLADPPVRGGDT